MLSNTDVLRDPAFIDRVYAYIWRPAPFLQKYKKKLHPFTWPLLVKKFITNQEITWSVDNNKLYNAFYIKSIPVKCSELNE